MLMDNYVRVQLDGMSQGCALRVVYFEESTSQIDEQTSSPQNRPAES